MRLGQAIFTPKDWEPKISGNLSQIYSLPQTNPLIDAEVHRNFTQRSGDTLMTEDDLLVMMELSSKDKL